MQVGTLRINQRHVRFLGKARGSHTRGQRTETRAEEALSGFYSKCYVSPHPIPRETEKLCVNTCEKGLMLYYSEVSIIRPPSGPTKTGPNIGSVLLMRPIYTEIHNSGAGQVVLIVKVVSTAELYGIYYIINCRSIITDAVTTKATLEGFVVVVVAVLFCCCFPSVFFFFSYYSLM